MSWIPDDYHAQFKQNINDQADCHMSAWVLKVYLNKQLMSEVGRLTASRQ